MTTGFIGVFTIIMILPSLFEILLFLKSSQDLKNAQDAKKIMKRNENYDVNHEVIKIIKKYNDFISSLDETHSDLKSSYAIEKNNNFSDINRVNALLNDIYQTKINIIKNKGE